MTDIHFFEPIFDGWVIKELLGKGGYGCVYRAVRKDNIDGQPYTYESAVKHISIPQDQEELDSAFECGYVTDDPSAREFYKQKAIALIQENQTMDKLHGSLNIVRYHDHKLVPKKDMPGYDLFIRMELLTPLTKLIKDKSLNQTDVVRIGVDIARALEELLEHNVIHRDVKPSNIFVDKKGNYKLGDFGVARQMEKSQTMMTKRGTHEYMAPEVFKGEPAGKTVDLYSLGLVLYRLLNEGRGPFLPEVPAPIFPNDIETAQNRRLMGDELPAPLAADEWLSKIVLKACAYRAEDRYQTPAELREALSVYTRDKEKGMPVDETKDSETRYILQGIADDSLSSGDILPPNTNTEPQEKPGRVRWPIIALIAGLAVTLITLAVLLVNLQAQKSELEVTPPLLSSEYLTIDSWKLGENLESITLYVSNISNESIVDFRLNMIFLDASRRQVDMKGLMLPKQDGLPSKSSRQGFVWSASTFKWAGVYSMDVELVYIKLASNPNVEVKLTSNKLNIVIPADMRVAATPTPKPTATPKPKPTATPKPTPMLTPKPTIKSVSFEDGFVFLTQGESCQITISDNIRAKANTDKWKWISSDPDTVSLGEQQWTITAKKPGIAFVSLSCDGSFSFDSCDTILCYVASSEPLAKTLTKDDFILVTDGFEIVLGSTTDAQIFERWPTGEYSVDDGKKRFHYSDYENKESIDAFLDKNNKVVWCNLGWARTNRGIQTKNANISDIILTYGLPTAARAFYYDGGYGFGGFADITYDFYTGDDYYYMYFNFSIREENHGYATLPFEYIYVGISYVE